MVHSTEISPDGHGALQHSSEKAHASNSSFLKCRGALCTPRCSLMQGTVLREVLKQQEEHPWRDEGCSRDTLVEMVRVPLSTSTPPTEHKTALTRLLLHCTSQTRSAWGQYWWLARAWAIQTGLGAEELGEDGKKPDQEVTREMHRLVGKAECWKGCTLYCSNTSFPCVQAKVTRCMIYLAQGKQLFRGSAGVFRQSCSVPEESHLQMLTALFYPLPASRSPAAILPSGCAADASGSHSALTSAFTSIS